MKLKVHQKNWLLSFHITSASLWFGTAFCSLALAVYYQNWANGNELYAINAARNLMGEFIIVPSAVSSLVSGLLLCNFTVWGFFKHYWVMAKQILTMMLIVIGSVWLGPLTKQATSISAIERLQVLQNPTYVSIRDAVIVVGAIQTLVLVIIIIISVLKPWGRRKTSP
ncbi:hypothetical protein DSM106972_086660 [Dulcicalothrix desertica PCC 7102]|uniref:DUF2269 domain-containing protein n=1 Tax=Dulcicalothrix desertica PCC 7102 TaxID=232991 RepID=A0A433US17_9CYAN|nr:hypothetical protein [Dulcicalothrix desertica]RUS96643.1 hypothetical protein DSM106972_086660 [Dulcicalothrix desertica PCC 7102]TWH43888.1 hypothetical protein CAL7102_07639 [Dulcicalothrix desertica PCC 7102]